VLLVRGSCIPGEVHVEMKRLGYPPLTLLGGAAALGNGVAGLLPCTRVPDGPLAPGVTLTTIADPRGPWHVKVVTVAPQAAWRLDTVLAQNALPGLETTSSMARRRSALVAVNGDFAQPGGRPVHAFAQDGRLVQTVVDPGGRTRAFAVQSRPPYLPHIGTAQEDVRLDVPGHPADGPVLSVNRGHRGRPRPDADHGRGRSAGSRAGGLLRRAAAPHGPPDQPARAHGAGLRRRGRRGGGQRALHPAAPRPAP
jgi:hypothetical protein